MLYFTFRMSRKEADIEIEHKKSVIKFQNIFFGAKGSFTNYVYKTR